MCKMNRKFLNQLLSAIVIVMMFIGTGAMNPQPAHALAQPETTYMINGDQWWSSGGGECDDDNDGTSISVIINNILGGNSGGGKCECEEEEGECEGENENGNDNDSHPTHEPSPVPTIYIPPTIAPTIAPTVVPCLEGQDYNGPEKDGCGEAPATPTLSNTPVFTLTVIPPTTTPTDKPTESPSVTPTKVSTVTPTNTVTVPTGTATYQPSETVEPSETPAPIASPTPPTRVEENDEENDGPKVKRAASTKLIPVTGAPVCQTCCDNNVAIDIMDTPYFDFGVRYLFTINNVQWRVTLFEGPASDFEETVTSNDCFCGPEISIDPEIGQTITLVVVEENGTKHVSEISMLSAVDN